MNKLKLILLPLLLLCAIVNGQTRTIATEIINREKSTVFAQNNKLFSVAENAWQPTEVLHTATLLEFNQVEAMNIIKQHPENLELSIPTANGSFEL